jgi:hypothetical protein
LLALFFQSTLTGQIDLTVDGGAEQSAVSDHEDDDCVDQHFPMPSSILGVNSPRKRPETAKCWNVIKRSRSSENTLVWARKWFNKGKEFTHVYIHDIEEDVRGGIVCNTPLRLHRFAKGANTKVSWVTTHATNNISRYHKSHAVADEVEKREKDLQSGCISHMLGSKEKPAPKIAKHPVDSVGNSMKRFMISIRQWQLTRQARWYIYTEMKISKRQFANTYFREMLGSYSEKPGDVAILSQDHLKKYVRAEFEVFKVFLKVIIAEKVTQSKGNLFAQLIHDGGTLKSKKKYQGIGLQFVDSKWRCNHVICTGFLQSCDGTDEGVSAFLSGSFYERTGVDLSSVVGRSIQDRATKSWLVC